VKGKLAFTESQHEALLRHLYPGDGREAIALGICGRRAGESVHRFCVQRIVNIPHDQCVRDPDFLRWPTDLLLPLLEEAGRSNSAVLKIHSHPCGLREFSRTDDRADRELFTTVSTWMDNDLPHVSAVMLPDGSIFGRMVQENRFTPLDVVAVVGEDLHFWHHRPNTQVDEFGRRTAQAFGGGTFQRLRRLSAAVIGCSGTGSVVLEQLARLGIGELTLVDPDIVEERNLNRIVNATRADALDGRPKVAVLARAIADMDLGTRVRAFQDTLFSKPVVEAVAECDVVFGCMDSVDGRWLLNRLATYYSMPYFDVGVKLIADGNGGVDHVGGGVHYMQPGGSSLASRGMFSMEDVRVAGLRRTDPAAYEDQVRSKYIERVAEDRPAVISVNMLFASLVVNEFLARIHPYRDDPNGEFAVHRVSLSAGAWMNETDGAACPLLGRHVGRGDVAPLLHDAELG